MYHQQGNEWLVLLILVRSINKLKLKYLSIYGVFAFWHTPTQRRIMVQNIFFNLIILLGCISNEQFVYTMITKSVYTINHSHKYWSTLFITIYYYLFVYEPRHPFGISHFFTLIRICNMLLMVKCRAIWKC